MPGSRCVGTAERVTPCADRRKSANARTPPPWRQPLTRGSPRFAAKGQLEGRQRPSSQRTSARETRRPLDSVQRIRLLDLARAPSSAFSARLQRDRRRMRPIMRLPKRRTRLRESMPFQILRTGRQASWGGVRAFSGTSGTIPEPCKDLAEAPESTPRGHRHDRLQCDATSIRLFPDQPKHPSLD